VIVILTERLPPGIELLTEAEPVNVILVELDTEHIRRTRAFAKSETTTEATPFALWAIETISMSEGLTTAAVTGVDVGHVPKVAVVGKKMPDAVDAAPPAVAAVPEK